MVVVIMYLVAPIGASELSFRHEHRLDSLGNMCRYFHNHVNTLSLFLKLANEFPRYFGVRDGKDVISMNNIAIKISCDGRSSFIESVIVNIFYLPQSSGVFHHDWVICTFVVNDIKN